MNSCEHQWRTTPGSDLTNYGSLRLTYQRKAKGNSSVISLYGFDRAEPAHADVASIANVKAGLDSSGLRKHLGDFMRAHRIKLRESDWIAWWRHSLTLASGAGFYEAESIWVLLDGAGLRKVRRIELTHGSVEHKGPGWGRIHGLTEKTRVTRKQYGG